MTQDDLIKMAKAAGFEVRLFNSIDGDEIVVGDYFLTDRLRDFASLVAEATKEECAGMIDNDDIHRGKWFAERIREMK